MSIDDCDRWRNMTTEEIRLELKETPRGWQLDGCKIGSAWRGKASANRRRVFYVTDIAKLYGSTAWYVVFKELGKEEKQSSRVCPLSKWHDRFNYVCDNIEDWYEFRKNGHQTLSPIIRVPARTSADMTEGQKG